MALDWSEPDPERQAAMLLHGEVGLGQEEEGRFAEWAINWFSWSLRLHCHFQHGYNMRRRWIWRQGSKGISKDLFFFFWSEMKGGRRREGRARSPTERNSLFFIFSNDLVCFIPT